jgi:hypothetical protein
MKIKGSISAEDAVHLSVNPNPPQRVPQVDLRSHPGCGKLSLESRTTKHTLGGHSTSSDLGSDSAPPQSIFRCDAAGSYFSSKARSAKDRLCLYIVQVGTVVARVIPESGMMAYLG